MEADYPAVAAGCSISLRNRAVVLLGQGGASSVQVSNAREGKIASGLNIPTTIFLCVFEPLWCHVQNLLRRGTQTHTHHLK